MRILIAFRGDYSVVNNPSAVCSNIKEKIIDPLRSKGDEVDILFFTYRTDMAKLGIYESHLYPIHTSFTNGGQIINFGEAMHYIKDIYDIYDYVLFLRFDIIYKMSIDKWNIFNKGITFTYKEESKELFMSHHFYGDVIISISKDSFKDILYALICTPPVEFIKHTLHQFGSIIQESYPHIQVSTILEGYFQSNTGIPEGDPRLNPLYIQVKYVYNGSDKELYTKYLNIV
jgi:hypothetical protein